MTKNIVYFGEHSLFSDTIKHLAQMEGVNFYDYEKWEDCEGQFVDLEPSFIFIDLDTFNPSSLGPEVESIECVFFKTHQDEELHWDCKYHFFLKPLEVLKFKEFLSELVNG